MSDTNKEAVEASDPIDTNKPELVSSADDVRRAVCKPEDGKACPTHEVGYCVTCVRALLAARERDVEVMLDAAKELEMWADCEGMLVAAGFDIGDTARVAKRLRTALAARKDK
jgi:hypothetical protein